MIAQFNMGKKIAGMKNLQLVDPLSYLDFLKLMLHATFVLTDSGGIQEETTALSIPCLTLRENTERPSTITIGTNILVGMNPERIRVESMKILNNDVKKGEIPPFWDGRTAERIVQILEERL
jgi:UDP-N-acetylglucosamine 2-epimerase (non-hydrolysing)